MEHIRQSLFTMEHSNNPSDHLKYFGDHPVITGEEREHRKQIIEKALRALKDKCIQKGFINEEDIQDIINGQA